MVSFRKCQLAERTSVASLTSRPVTSKSSARILLLCQGASPVAHALLHSSPEGGHWLRSSGSGLTVVEHSYEKTQDAHDHCRRRAGCGGRGPGPVLRKRPRGARWAPGRRWDAGRPDRAPTGLRSEEHTSELQSPCNLVCRLLLEKKKKKVHTEMTPYYT